MHDFPIAEQYITVASKGYFQACLDILLGDYAEIDPDALRERIERLISKRVETRAVVVGSSPQHKDAELIEYLKAIDNAWRGQRVITHP